MRPWERSKLKSLCSKSEQAGNNRKYKVGREYEVERKYEVRRKKYCFKHTSYF